MSSLYSYPLFHCLAELFSIVVAWGIFVVAWNARKILDNNYLLFIGIAYLFVAFLDLIHTLAYKGMGVFIGYDSNLPTQLWIISRYMESISLLLAPVFINRKLMPWPVLALYAAVTSLLIVSVFYWKNFPACYIEGQGLTPFKIYSEYIISSILLGAATFLIVRRSAFDNSVWKLVIASIAFTIASELSFTLYLDVYGFYNLLGHMFKLISFYLMYQAIIVTGMTKPYTLLYRNLKQSEEELVVRAQELARLNAQLIAANEELESFAYSVSHDLRAPLRSIDGFARALEETSSEKLDAEGREFLHYTRLSAAEMANLIEDLLRLSRVTRGEMRNEEVDLSGIVKAITAQLKKAEPERQVEFVIAENVKHVADERLLHAALENLIDNSWKFTRLHPRARIEFGMTVLDGETVYFVRDDGAGFDMKYADKLFTPFKRLHNADEFPGTGIGLATVQRIIHRHGGRIWFEGEKGKGATFYFTLGQQVSRAGKLTENTDKVYLAAATKR